MEPKLCLFCVEDAEPSCFKEHRDWITKYPTAEDMELTSITSNTEAKK